jgi:hypothetical protein
LAFVAKSPLHKDNIAASSPKRSILWPFGASWSGCRITFSIRARSRSAASFRVPSSLRAPTRSETFRA